MTAIKIALTGGIASGKTLACTIFNQLSVPTISADKIAAELFAPGTQAFTMAQERFGTELINNRTLLKQHIFDNYEDKIWLENLLHPLILTTIEKQCKNIHSPYIVIEIPLLIEAQLKQHFDQILVIDCPTSLQISRAMERDRCDLALTQKIIQQQATREQRLAIADCVLHNDKSIEYLTQQIKHYYATLLKYT